MTIHQIHKLHTLYIALTGLEIRLDMNREREWFEWSKNGFTEDDLRLVILHLKKGIQNGKRNPGALKFRNLISQPDFFEEDLQEAKQAQRAFRPQTPRDKVLQQAQRAPAPQSKPARTAAEVLATPEAKAFFQLKGKL